jgi:hypothetical protein
MTRIRLIIGLILASMQCAHTQTARWTGNVMSGCTCMAPGRLPWACRANNVCYSEDLFPGDVTAAGGPAITNSSPTCEPGWTLVIAGHPMCAHELKEPK